MIPESKRCIALPEMSGQRVLITGGLGFVGSNLALKCLELGAGVTIYDCLDPRSGGNMYNVQGIRDSVSITINDIRNFEATCSAVVDSDVVFNCAAYTSHPNSMKEPLIDIDVNCKGVINVLEAVKRFNPGAKLVHVGTSTQIGRMRYTPVDEEHPEFPAEIYSANKVASEKYVLIYGRAYGLRATVVRLANVYGPRSNIQSSDFGFMNYFVGLALQNRGITIFGEGSQTRNAVYVDDAVAALILASQCEGSNNETFFGASDQEYTILEIATGIVDAIGGELQFVAWPKEREGIEIGDAAIKNDKIKTTMGWRPCIDLVEGLIRTREYYSDCLKEYLK